MPIIKSYAEFDTEAEIEQTIENYPGLTNFFQIKEAVGATSIVDTITKGVVAATVAAGDVLHAKDIVIVNDSPIVGGAFPNMAGKATLYFCVFQKPSLNFAPRLGLIASPSLLFHSGTANGVYADESGETGTTVWTLNAPNDILIRCFLVDAITNNVNGYEFNGTTFNAIAPAAMTGPSTYGAFDSNISIGGLVEDVYAIPVIQLDSVPSNDDMETILIWMWDTIVTKGEKVICPLLRGRT